MLSIIRLRVLAIFLVATLTLITVFFLVSPQAPLNLSALIRDKFRPRPSIDTLTTIGPPLSPISDNFPLLAHYRPPPIPFWNQLPPNTTTLPTPLLIGFTRNWPLLQQTLVSYLTAGWPASQIYIIDNTGTQTSNRRGLLTIQNPFYLNYTRLTTVFNVTVVETPTLLTFAQLQNYFLWHASERGWDYFFWSHMDAVALSDESFTVEHEYKGLYARVLDVLEETLVPAFGAKQKWALRFFAYDHLTLVNTAASLDVGGWDPFISYYLSDCDMYGRLGMAGYKTDSPDVGRIYDIATSLEDLLVLYRRTGKADDSNHTDAHELLPAAPDTFPLAERMDDSYFRLREQLDAMDHWKNDNVERRNTWQMIQKGGQGEPFYYEPKGFQRGVEMANENGRNVYYAKWGGDTCAIRGKGLKKEDAWKAVT